MVAISNAGDNQDNMVDDNESLLSFLMMHKMIMLMDGLVMMMRQGWHTSDPCPPLPQNIPATDMNDEDDH